MRKKVNKRGNRTYTVKELQDFLTKLDCDRAKAIELGKKIGMAAHAVDTLRGLLGFTAKTPERIPQEKIDRLIEVFKDNPEKSLYQIYREYKDKLGLLGGYQTYYAIIRKAGLECNRKRNYWSVFKDKKLVYLHEVEKLSFGQIQLQFPERTRNALMQRYEKLKRKGAA
jgi:hypothetical protein